jgi:hypothetical protein
VLSLSDAFALDLHGSSMHYFEYFMGTYPPENEYVGHAYLDSHINVLVNFK